MGEASKDTGGLRREFWRLFVNAAAKEYFIGTDNLKTFQQNVPALQVPCDIITRDDFWYIIIVIRRTWFT